jgi:MFS family permease
MSHERERAGETGLRQAMRIAALDGLFASASDNFAVPYITLFALSMGGSTTQIGLIAALTALVGNLMQLPMAALTERRWRRKYWCVLSGLLARGLWVPIALLPFYATGIRAIWIYVALLAFRALAGSLGQPAWTALMADITPRRVRGSFFAYRNILMNISGLVATLVGGWLIRQWGAPLGYQIAFGAAFVCGMVATATFARLPEPEREHPTTREGAEARRWRHLSLRHRLQMLAAHLREEKTFTAYALVSLVWTFGLSFPQPLFAAHFVNRLGGTAYLWGLVSSTSMVATLIGQRYWGPLADRFGGYRIMVVSGVGAASVPLLWRLAPDFRFVFPINLISGFMWAGYNLGAFNLLLDVTPDRRRATYVAGYNGLIGLSATAAPFLGGLLSDLVGIPLVFLLSFLVRLAGWGLLARFVHPVRDRPMEWRQLVPEPLRAGRRD